jgi:hypothetical protein
MAPCVLLAKRKREDAPVSSNRCAGQAGRDGLLGLDAAAQNRDAGRESLQVKPARELRIQNGGAGPGIQEEGKTLYRSG